jgi:hypothetical protein
MILEGYTRPDHIKTEDIREENNVIKTNKAYMGGSKNFQNC